MSSLNGAMLILLLLVFCIPVSCTAPNETGDTLIEPEASGPEALVDNGLWVYASEKEDPFAAERPIEIQCPEWSYQLEYGAFEVDTAGCNFLTVTQPILAKIRAGDRVIIALWHQNLVAEPATAHVAVSLGGELLWETYVTIPSPPGAYTPEIVVSSDYPKGTPIIFHLHNHGSNNWQLLELTRYPP
jgi:hypothetical protein